MTTRADELDISQLDRALLSILVPRVHSMFKYINKGIPSWARTGNVNSPSSIADITDSISVDYGSGDGRMIMIILRGLLFLSTIRRSSGDHARNKYIIETPGMSIAGVGMISGGVRGDSLGNTRKLDTPQQRLNQFFDQRLLRYLLLSILCPLLYESLRLTKIHYDNVGVTNTMDQSRNGGRQQQTRTRTQQRALQRKKTIVNFVMKFLSRVVPPLQLYFHLSFLANPSANRSTMAMNLAGMDYSRRQNTPRILIRGKSATLSLSPARRFRHINFLYAYRKLLYHELLLLAYAVIPVTRLRAMPSALNSMIVRLRLSIKLVLDRILVKLSRRSGGMRSNTNSENDISFEENTSVQATCPLCSLDKITIPYITSCGHMYCFTCLRQAVMDKQNYKCATCGATVISSCRLSPSISLQN